MYNNYQSIKYRINNQLSFKGNSTEGYYSDLGYTIKSYNTIIYSDKEGLNTEFYSVTTSKLQNIIAQAFYNSTIQELRKYNQKTL